MHPTEPQNAFLVMRGNGWSLGRKPGGVDPEASTLLLKKPTTKMGRFRTKTKFRFVRTIQHQELPTSRMVRPYQNPVRPLSPAHSRRFARFAGTEAAVIHSSTRFGRASLPPLPSVKP